MGFCDKPKKPRKKRKLRPKRATKPTSGRVRTREAWSVAPTGSKGAAVPCKHFLTTPTVMEEPTNWIRRTMFELISDTKGFIQSWQNPCHHFKYWEIGEVIPPQNLLSASTCTLALSQAKLPDMMSMVQSVLPVPDYDVIGALARDSIRHFQNAVDPKVLLLNFIIELIETVKSAASKAHLLPKIWEQIQKRYARMLRLLLSKGVLEADAHLLAWSFAIKPFKRDLEGIFCSIEAAEERTKWLLRHADKPTRIRYQRRVDVGEPADYTVYGSVPGHYYGPWNPNCPPWIGGCSTPERGETAGRIRLQAELLEYTYSAQATVVYKLPPCRITEDSGIGIVWASMMGLDRIGSAIWEAIPFSFVIDWFTDIGKQAALWIDDKTQNFPDGQILEVGHSFKLLSHWRVDYIHEPSILEPQCGTLSNLGRVGYKQYSRKTGLPEGSTLVFDLGGLTDPYHAALSTALVTTRVRALNKRRRKLISDIVGK